MAHLFGIKPWEWDRFDTYGQMLGFCQAIDRHRMELAKANK